MDPLTQTAWGALAPYGLLGLVTFILALATWRLFGMLQTAHDKIIALQEQRLADLREIGTKSTTALTENSNALESLEEVIKDRRASGGGQA